MDVLMKLRQVPSHSQKGAVCKGSSSLPLEAIAAVHVASCPFLNGKGVKARRCWTTQLARCDCFLQEPLRLYHVVSLFQRCSLSLPRQLYISIGSVEHARLPSSCLLFHISRSREKGNINSLRRSRLNVFYLSFLVVSLTISTTISILSSSVPHSAAKKLPRGSPILTCPGP